MKSQLHFHPIDAKSLREAVRQNVEQALTEDRVDGDISAGLIDEQTLACAQVITRESGIFCGAPWVDETLKQLDETMHIKWQVADGDKVLPNQELFQLRGKARSLLSAERTMLNFVQLLSGTATRTARYVGLIADTQSQLLDTRKTVPGLRLAQKYAVKCGGGSNHRTGLYDAFLLKENHILAAGSIGAAVKAAKASAPNKPVEIEVESLAELQQAMEAGADIALIDNFSVTDSKAAVAMTRGNMVLEASGGITQESIAAIAATGVDYISCGDLTKSVEPMDLSMRFLVDESSA
ncbi:carboxylating nicotinate-nucleotide diphosphorylase [Gammaproteobacteria bacterium]|nr:carboxylating nicotinate-nucleotide diphosphorylase [Gammaproteobacteria bacterium]